MTRQRQTLCIMHCALCIMAFATTAAQAITESEYNADPTLIPTASASSPFYVVAPSSLSGEQEIDALATGLDSTPTEREYDFTFDTELTTRHGATVLYLR